MIRGFFCRFDEAPIGVGSDSKHTMEGAFGSNTQRRAAQAQAERMGTGGFLNPPPGEAFDEGHTNPAVAAANAPDAVKGAADAEPAGDLPLKQDR